MEITRRRILTCAALSCIPWTHVTRPGLTQILFGAAEQRKRTTPLRIATFGDSTAMVSSLSRTDVSAWDVAFRAGTNNTTHKIETALVLALYSQAYLVGDGGIGGQTAATMLARSGNSPSSTRKAIEDIIALSPDVVLLRGGSINDFVGFRAPITQANINSVVANHLLIISAFNSAGIYVIDCGIYGYSGATNTSQVQAAILNFNSQLAGRSGGLYKFIDIRGVTCDPTTGAYLRGISSDGAHLGNGGGFAVGKLEVAELVAKFGTPAGTRYVGANAVSNFNLTQFGLQAYGTLGDGWQLIANSTTRANANIETIGGITYQTCEFTPTADAGNGQVKAPFRLNGASPDIAISAGQIYGLEFDFIIAGLNWGAPPAGSFLARMDIVEGTSRNNYTALLDGSNDALGGFVMGHAIFPPIAIPDFGGTQVNITASEFLLSFTLSTANDRTPFKLGLGNPRMVLLA